MSPPASPHDLPSRLRHLAATGEVDMPYRLARLVARVLVSTHLRQRAKWCTLAQDLAADPSVENRLVAQAIGWLHRQPGRSPPSHS